MRPGMRCVLEVLLGQTGSRKVAEQEWYAALALAEEEQVLPFLLSCLEHRATTLPEGVQAFVQEKQRDAVIAGFFWKSELKELLRAFSAASVPVIPLKGPSFAQRIYGDVALRPSKDLDLLVKPGDIARTKLVLMQQGFVSPGRPEDYTLNWLRGTIKVELHFNVAHPREFDFDLDIAWKRARLGTFADQPAWELAAEDEFLFLCLHGVRHRFERLSHVLDISLAARFTLDNIGREFCLRPVGNDLTIVLLLGCLMAKRLDPVRPEAWPIVGSKYQQQAMETFANVLWRQLLDGTVLKRNGWTWHRFYVRLEIRPFYKPARRLWHLSFLVMRLIEADFVFASKLGLRRTWQVRLVKPLRLLLKYGRRRTSVLQ
jgi:hypothetical protein